MKNKSVVCSLVIVVIAGSLLTSCKVSNLNPVGSTGGQLKAVAGANQRMNTGALVTLDGSGSTSPNGGPLSYFWTMTARPASSTAVLSGSSTVSPSFTADAVGEYLIQLIVSDGNSNSNPSTVSVNALDTSPTCTTDNVTGLPTSGALLVGPSDDIVPLCSGSLLLGDRSANTVKKMDVLSGTAGTYPLTAAPGDLDLDAQNGFLYAAQPSGNSVTRIDLVNNTQNDIAVSPGAVHVAVGNNGDVFATLGNSAYYHNVALINGPTSTVEKVFSSETGSAVTVLIVFDKTHNQLIAGDTGISPSELSRYSFDPIGRTFTLTESLSDAGSNGEDIVISPDDNHIAFINGAGNGTPPYTIYDFSSSNFTTVSGAWVTDVYPTSADFDPTGQYLAATNGSSLQIFSVSTHAKLAEYTLDLTGCSYTAVNKVRYSRGGRIIYLFANCGFSGDSGKLFWLVY
jgi:hypothetical protein